ncbi:MAG: hypothetical protein C0613_07340 [Desulfobulbaceae bacterium]|nr:MAG: hypothetical protein C0613_07340 [Desulfobulbaceae bacterium]
MKTRPFTLPLISTLLMLLASANLAWSADCLAIRKNIEEQNDILQRKELASQGISDCPNDPVINFEYAYSMERFRKYKIALKHYQAAAKLAPKFSKSYFGMGDMYLQLDRPKDAIKAYETGLSLEPENQRAMNSLQEARLAAKKMGDSDESIAGFVNPLAPEKPAAAPLTVPQKNKGPELPPVPYEPTQAFIMHKPATMQPLVATPLQPETLQKFVFDKAGHSDITGSLDDKEIGAD